MGIPKAFWAKNARKILEVRTKSSSNKKIDLYQALNNIDQVSGWLRKWIPWIAAWKRSKGSYQDSFLSSFFQKNDFYCNNINATEYNTKVGTLLLLRYHNKYPFRTKIWNLLWKLPINNKEKEIIWKFLTNSIATGRRTRFYRTISCSFCDLPDFDRQHLVSECYIAKKTIQLLSTKLKLYINYTNWEVFLSQKWIKGRLNIEGPKFLVFSLFLTEIYYQFYKKAANTSYYVDYKILVHNIIRRFKDHINIVKLNNFNKKYVKQLQFICNNIN